MSGSGTGRLTSQELEKLRKEARKRLDESKRDTQINSYLQQLLAGFNDRDVEKVGEYLNKIEDALGSDLEFDRMLFGGSVAKHTHVNGLSDIDSLVVFDGKSLLDRPSSEIVELLRSSLRQRLPTGDIDSIESGDLAVTVKYRDGTEIQLLPAVSTAGKISIPSAPKDDWVDISPRQFTQRLTETNRDQGGAAIPAIKLAKAILANRLGEKAPSGYHVEAIAVAAFRDYSGPRTPQRMLMRLIAEAGDIVMRRLRDFTGQSRYVDEYLGRPESNERRELSESLRRLSRTLSSKSVRDWRSLFEE